MRLFSGIIEIRLPLPGKETRGVAGASWSGCGAKEVRDTTISPTVLQNVFVADSIGLGC